MDNNVLMTTIFTLISLFGLWLLFFVLYRDFVVDKFRQSMFAVRDEMFDYVSKNGISFDDPAYTLLRSTMNGFIRYAHKVSFLQLFLFSRMTKEIDTTCLKDSFHDKWIEAIKLHNGDTKNQFENYLVKMNIQSLKLLLFSSPVLNATILVPIILLTLVKLYIKKLLEKFDDQINRLDSTAMLYGNAKF